MFRPCKQILCVRKYLSVGGVDADYAYVFICRAGPLAELSIVTQLSKH